MGMRPNGLGEREIVRQYDLLDRRADSGDRCPLTVPLMEDDAAAAPSAFLLVGPWVLTNVYGDFMLEEVSPLMRRWRAPSRIGLRLRARARRFSGSEDEESSSIGAGCCDARPDRLAREAERVTGPK